jgi:hypothetical protein
MISFSDPDSSARHFAESWYGSGCRLLLNSDPDLDPDQDFCYDKEKICWTRNVIQYCLLKFLNPNEGHSGSSPAKISSDMFLHFFLLSGTISACLDPDPIRIRNTGEHTVLTGIKHKCSTQNLLGYAYDSSPLSVIYRTLDYSTLVVSCFSSLSLSVWRFYFLGKISQSFQLYSRSPLLL